MDAKPLVALLALLVVLPLASASPGIGELLKACNGTLYAVIYGQHTCPHCRASYNGLRELGVNVTFLDVQTDAEAQREWAELYIRYFKPLGVTPGVPLIKLVCGNVTLYMLGSIERHELLRILPYPEGWERLILGISRGAAPTAAGYNASIRLLACIPVTGAKCNSLLEKARENLEKQNKTSLAPYIACVADVALCYRYGAYLAERNATSAQSGTNATTATATQQVTSTMRPQPSGVFGQSQPPSSLILLIPFIVSMALIDAINPCFLALYSITIAAVATIRGYRAAVATGLGVALGVFTGYYLLGLGLIRAIQALPVLRDALAAAVIALGVLMLLEARGVVNEECWVCKLAQKLRVGTASMTPTLGYAFGFIASLTLLPCSAGPYMIVTLQLADRPLAVQLLALTIYNMVFIAPIVAMCLAASMVARFAWLQEKARPFIAVLLIALGVYVLVQPELGLALGG